MPKKFSFSLESVLNVRKMIEQQRERSFSDALKAVNKEQNTLKNIEDIITKKTGEFNSIKNKPVSAQLHTVYQQYLAQLELDVIKQKKVLDEKKQELEHKRRQMIDAMRERKLLDRLKDKDKERYLAKINHWLQIQLDDIAGIRYLQMKRDK